MLRCINLLERPTQGRVIVNQVDLTSLSTAQLREHRHKIGMIFQHYNLLESRTAFENIALPLEIIHQSTHDINAKVNALLDLIGMQDKKNHLPSQLSGGQKQRIAIARALAADPYVLLCDEVTSALDSESTKSILNLLKQINRELGVTILLITHEIDVIKRICDKTGVMDHGRLVEQDLTIDVLVNPKTTITRQLVQQALHLYVPEQQKDDVLVLKLTFIGDDSNEPLISTLAKRFNISMNIKQALIEKIQETTVGFTICELTGQKADRELAMQYIKSTSVKVEVLNNA